MGPCWPLARFRNDPQTPIWSQKVGVYETKGVLQMLAIILSAATLLPASDTYSLDQVLEAVRQVETGSLPDQGRGARGDGGLALGPWQIHRAFFIDAAERDKSLNIYSRCLGELDYSRRVVKAYWRRYSRAAYDRLAAGCGSLSDAEAVSRIHNGGPRGGKKAATRAYWQKVRRLLSI